MRQIQGEYACFLDADDVFLPDKLESQVRFLADIRKWTWFTRTITRAIPISTLPVSRQFESHKRTCWRSSRCETGFLPGADVPLQQDGGRGRIR